MKKRILASVARVLGTVGVVVCLVGCLIAQPTFRRNRPSSATVDAQRLRSHVETISETFRPRDWLHVANLDRCADYIAACFTNAGAAVAFQPVAARGYSYRNVIGRFGAGLGSKVVIGAHYDACGEGPAADDNASGVAVLLELGDLLRRNPPRREVELVAYVLEEPPFFRTPHMGSAVHAESLLPEKHEVAGMIALEMVGYFSDARGSQSYPSLLLRVIYPGRGNFVAVVGAWDQGDWVKAIKVGMKGTTDLPVYSIRAPSALPGIDLSDHLNYGIRGFPSLMVTDTAFYRNKAYHSAEDTADRLDYERMAKVAVAVFEAIRTP